MEKNIIGKSNAETMTAGWRTVRSTERCASAATWVKSEEPILRLSLLGPCTLERPSRLLQKHVVQARLVEPQVGDLEVLGVQGAYHVGKVAGPVVEAYGDGAGPRGDLLSEAYQGLRDGGALLGTRGGCLDARASDLGFERLRRVLGDDTSPVDDPDPICQHVGLLQVLRRQEDRHPVLAREAAHLRPQRAAALGIEACRRLAQEKEA